MDGATNAIRAYKNSHPFTPSLLIRVIQGANNVGNIISAMASHLNLYRGFIDGLTEVSLLDSIWKMAAQETDPLHSKLLSAHRESRPLWTSIFSLQRRTANDDHPLIGGYTDGHISVIIPLVHHTANTISHCISKDSLKECVDLIACWVAADFFGTLDVIIPFFAHGPRSCSSNHPCISYLTANPLASSSFKPICQESRSHFLRYRMDAPKSPGTCTSTPSTIPSCPFVPRPRRFIAYYRQPGISNPRCGFQSA